MWMLIFLCVLAMSKFLVQRSALSRDLSRALGPRDPPRQPLSTSARPPRPPLSLSGPAAAIPGPRAGRREAPAAAAARRIPPSPHPPRLAASRIHPSSPHRRISQTRTGGQPRPQQDPRDLCPPSPICNSFLAGLQLFFVLFPSHLLDLILLNLNKSFL